MKKYKNNTLTGQHNAILGGTGNNNNGFDCVAIYGNGINAVANNAFHADNYVIRDMPLGSFGLPTGQLYFNVGGSGLNEVFVA